MLSEWSAARREEAALGAANATQGNWLWNLGLAVMLLVSGGVLGGAATMYWVQRHSKGKNAMIAQNPEQARRDSISRATMASLERARLHLRTIKDANPTWKELVDAHEKVLAEQRKYGWDYSRLGTSLQQIEAIIARRESEDVARRIADARTKDPALESEISAPLKPLFAVKPETVLRTLPARAQKRLPMKAAAAKKVIAAGSTSQKTTATAFCSRPGVICP